MPFPKDKYESPRDYEQKLSGKIPGSKPEVASGSFSGDYDITSRDNFGIMADAKKTDAKSFSLNAEKFKAIEKRSSLDQMPAIFVNFSKYNLSLAIVKQDDLIEMYKTMKNLI